jgi:hypothetical protein
VASMAPAQQKQTTKLPVEHPLPVSHYMRKTGVVYLSRLSDFERDCETSYEECKRASDSLDRLMSPLEQQINIDLDEKGRPAGDLPYFDLLKRTRRNESMYLSAHAVAMLLQRDRKAAYEKRIQDILAGRDPGPPSEQENKEFSEITKRDSSSKLSYDGCAGLASIVADDGALFKSLADDHCK